MEFPEPIKAIWAFAARVLTGIVLFVVIGFAASILNLLTTYETAHQLLPNLMLSAMVGLAYFIFAIDLIVFPVFLVKEGLKAVGILPRD